MTCLRDGGVWGGFAVVDRRRVEKLRHWKFIRQGNFFVFKIFVGTGSYK